MNSFIDEQDPLPVRSWEMGVRQSEVKVEYCFFVRAGILDNDLRRPAGEREANRREPARKGSAREKRANSSARFANFNDFVLNAGKVAMNRVR